jgi:thymidylate kinase
MPDPSGRHRSHPLTEHTQDAVPRDAAGVLTAVFELLDRDAVPYCLLNGHEDEAQQRQADVDCIVSTTLGPDRLLTLLHRESHRIGAEVVRAHGYRLILAGRNDDGSPCFVDLDPGIDCEVRGHRFYAGHELLRNRRRHQGFWVPAAPLAFGCTLVRRIAKGGLDGRHADRLNQLYRQDSAGCDEQVERFWGARSASVIRSAAHHGDWEPVRRRVRRLGIELRWRAMLRSPGHLIRSTLSRLATTASRCWRSDSGLNVVLLGPDGAGKSSVIRAVGAGLIGAFRRTAHRRFTPALIDRLLGRTIAPNSDPHALPTRSFVMSTMRASLYWLPYYALDHVTDRLVLARSTLVLHDRHPVDAFVDPLRHRYGGPSWLLRLIWRLIPKPDLVILLDAPAGVLQARKHEVPFEESARQREAYIALMAAIGNAHVVDAARPLQHVVADVNDVILRHLALRVARRHGLPQATEPSPNIIELKTRRGPWTEAARASLRAASSAALRDGVTPALVAPVVTTMPKASLPVRIAARATRNLKRVFGVDSYLKGDDRRVLEQIIFPHVLLDDAYQRILFVGCDWYTSGYNGRFEKTKSYWTIDIKPSHAKYGAKRHIIDSLQNLEQHFGAGTFDLILCNGVFGWGLDANADVEQAFQACHKCLRHGGVLVVGWDDIEEKRPFPLQDCQSLRAFDPFVFPPLGTAEYLTDTSFRHTYTFYSKR